MYVTVNVVKRKIWSYRCLTAPSGPSRSSCFSRLSRESLLARLAFLQDVWLLQKQQNLRIRHFLKVFSASLMRKNASASHHLSICFLCPSTWLRMVCLLNSLSCSIAICSKSCKTHDVNDAYGNCRLLMQFDAFAEIYCSFLPEFSIWDCGNSFLLLHLARSADFEDLRTVWCPAATHETSIDDERSSKPNLLVLTWSSDLWSSRIVSLAERNNKQH